MSYYYNSFTYKDTNSLKDKGLIIVSFEPDDGFVDTFLSMDSIQEDSFDNTFKFDYGAKYNKSATIDITMIKCNKQDISLSEFRSLAKWLTGARLNSWLDVYVNKEEPSFSFLGKVTDFQQYKMDGRTIGVKLTFTSASPWAYSTPQNLQCYFGQKLHVNENGVLYMDEQYPDLDTDEDGALYVADVEDYNYFELLNDGTVYIPNVRNIEIDNDSDDLYSYTYLDTEIKNVDSQHIIIDNNTLDEQTYIYNINKNENINLHSKQFIMSDNPGRTVFGDDFSFTWPRLASGVNDMTVSGSGECTVDFTYRYPMKVGDCTMDIKTYGSDTCDECPGGANWDGVINWEDIIGTPTTLGGYGITDAYTTTEVDEKIDNIECTGGSGSVDIDEEELDNALSELFD